MTYLIRREPFAHPRLLVAFVAIVVLGLAAYTVLAADWGEDIAATTAGPLVDTSATPIPAPWAGVSPDTWTELYASAVAANVDFSLWEAEGNAGQVQYFTSFTPIRIGEKLNLLPCIPTYDASWTDFLTHVESMGYTVALNDAPALDIEGHPLVHATTATVLMPADSRELIAQQATNLFRWINNHDLTCY